MYKVLRISSLYCPRCSSPQANGAFESREQARIPCRVPYPRKELIIRLHARRCELCGKMLVHQVRNLASLGEPGARPAQVGGLPVF